MKLNRHFKIRAKLWRYSAGAAAWHFLTLPKKQSAYIKQHFGLLQNGWGSVRVSITVGKTTWLTSIFPDNKAGTYLLPIKAAVRRNEKLTDGKSVSFTVEIR